MGISPRPGGPQLHVRLEPFAVCMDASVMPSTGGACRARPAGSVRPRSRPGRSVLRLHFVCELGDRAERLQRSRPPRPPGRPRPLGGIRVQAESVRRAGPRTAVGPRGGNRRRWPPHPCGAAQQHQRLAYPAVRRTARRRGPRRARRPWPAPLDRSVSALTRTSTAISLPEPPPPAAPGPGRPARPPRGCRRVTVTGAGSGGRCATSGAADLAS